MRFVSVKATWRLTAAVWLTVAATTAIGDGTISTEPTLTYTAQPIRTAEVNESGKRHDTSSIECVTAPPGRLFEQASFVTRVVHHYDDDDRRCSPSFSDYKDLVPGIQEPTTACLTSFVVSKGGIFSKGKRGHLTCAMDYRLHPADAAKSAAGGASAPSHDVATVLPSIPASLQMERNSRSLLRATIPLAALQFGIDKGIAESNANLPLGFSVAVMSSRFDSYTPGSPTMKYYIDTDISGPIGARCEVTVAFAIPPATVENVLVQDVGTTANCRTGSLAGQLANLPQLLSNAIRSEVTKSLGKKLNEGGGTFDDWRKEDPEWAKLMLQARLQGTYCDWQGKPGLCVTAGWRTLSAFNDWESNFLANVPQREGPVDKSQVGQKLAHYESVARQTRMISAGLLRFPSGVNADGTPEDGDMALFGGLLCRSGSTDGCELLRNANTGDGRFWRSPRRVNEADTPKHSTFSGDQIRGVFHYFTVVRDDVRLRSLLRYVGKQRTFVPDAKPALEVGYSSCPNRYPNFTCFLAGDDWAILKLLALHYGMPEELPPDLTTIESAYGFDYEQLLWQSLITNAGFRLHLVANTAWIMKGLGQTDSRIDQVIKILNARQPQNPFFAYLLYGADKRVERLADAKCLPPDSPRGSFADWAWQRDDNSERWKVSMVWDCVFIYGLLARDPLPAAVTSP